MARFYPLYVRRSDGKIEIASKGRNKRKDLNQPTQEQLDQKPDKDGVSDFYREVALDEPKHLDWRRKLGGMLARELDWKDKSGGDGGYILVAFPENYRLYEHIKKTEKDGKLEVKNKTHAAGGNDRQDAYLYGHPVGKRKRFRSPGDFFPHLLWLCTDESGDPDNCTCKLCAPEDAESVAPGGKAKQDKPIKPETNIRSASYQGSVSASPAIDKSASVKPESATGPIANQILQSARPSAHATQQQALQSNRPTQYQQQQQVARSTDVGQARSPFPTQWKSPDQQMDAQYGGFMYRSGELVWFKRSQAWGLGVIFRRWSTGPRQQHYAIQPLSHPFSYPAPLVKSLNEDLRPWLAWSVPLYTHDGLNHLQDPPRWETADWQGIGRGKYGTGDLEVDGSILAAKHIDNSFTFVGKPEVIKRDGGVVDMCYDGIFLGAEKIWVGEPVRLEPGPTGPRILIVKSIFLRRLGTEAVAPDTVQIIGDIYSLTASPHSDPNLPSPASASSNPLLPMRLIEDLAHRNARSIAVQRMAQWWKLSLAMARFRLNDIKGRWYESSLLLPILQPLDFQDSLRKGEIPETSKYMNGRLDCLNANRAPTLPRIQPVNYHHTTRRAAFGQAVPSNVDIVDGVDAPAQNVDPLLAAAGDAMQIDRSATASASGGNGGKDAAHTQQQSQPISRQSSQQQQQQPQHQQQQQQQHQQARSYGNPDLAMGHGADAGGSESLDDFMSLDNMEQVDFGGNFADQMDGHQDFM